MKASTGNKLNLEWAKSLTKSQNALPLAATKSDTSSLRDASVSSMAFWNLKYSIGVDRVVKASQYLTRHLRFVYFTESPFGAYSVSIIVEARNIGFGGLNKWFFSLCRSGSSHKSPHTAIAVSLT